MVEKNKTFGLSGIAKRLLHVAKKHAVDEAPGEEQQAQEDPSPLLGFVQIYRDWIILERGRLCSQQ